MDVIHDLFNMCQDFPSSGGVMCILTNRLTGSCQLTCTGSSAAQMCVCVCLCLGVRYLPADYEAAKLSICPCHIFSYRSTLDEYNYILLVILCIITIFPAEKVTWFT